MQRFPGSSPGLSGELAQQANGNPSAQLFTPQAGGSNPFLDKSAHVSAIVALAWIVFLAWIVAFLLFHSHASLAASLGVGK